MADTTYTFSDDVAHHVLKVLRPLHTAKTGTRLPHPLHDHARRRRSPLAGHLTNNSTGSTLSSATYAKLL